MSEKCAWPGCRSRDTMGWCNRNLCEKHFSLPTAKLHEQFFKGPQGECACETCVERREEKSERKKGPLRLGKKKGGRNA